MLQPARRHVSVLRRPRLDERPRSSPSPSPPCSCRSSSPGARGARRARRREAAPGAPPPVRGRPRHPDRAAGPSSRLFDPPAATLGLAAFALGIAGARLLLARPGGALDRGRAHSGAVDLPRCLLFFSPVEKLVFPPQAHAKLAVETRGHDVVFLILDEFPTSSLMNANGQIDAARYPNFGDLARHSTGSGTQRASTRGTHAACRRSSTRGCRSEAASPTFADHPQNIFTLLGGRYRMNVWETQTHLCPTRLCRGKGELSNSFVARMHSLFEDARDRLPAHGVPLVAGKRIPDVGTAWGHYRRVADRGATLREGPLREVPGLDPTARPAPDARSRAHPAPARDLGPAAVLPSGHHSGLLAGPRGARQRLGLEPLARGAGLPARTCSSSRARTGCSGSSCGGCASPASMTAR